MQADGNLVGYATVDGGEPRRSGRRRTGGPISVMGRTP